MRVAHTRTFGVCYRQRADTQTLFYLGLTRAPWSCTTECTKLRKVYPVFPVRRVRFCTHNMFTIIMGMVNTFS